MHNLSWSPSRLQREPRPLLPPRLHRLELRTSYVFSAAGHLHARRHRCHSRKSVLESKLVLEVAVQPHQAVPVSENTVRSLSESPIADSQCLVQRSRITRLRVDKEVAYRNARVGTDACSCDHHDLARLEQRVGHILQQLCTSRLDMLCRHGGQA